MRHGDVWISSRSRKRSPGPRHKDCASLTLPEKSELYEFMRDMYPDYTLKAAGFYRIAMMLYRDECGHDWQGRTQYELLEGR